jgi:ABC-type Na+ transport system ATPase subunit NatA
MQMKDHFQLEECMMDIVQDTCIGYKEVKLLAGKLLHKPQVS